MKYNRILIVFLSAMLVLVSLSGCIKSIPVKIVDGESSLLGFSVTDKVEFLCSVTVMNTSDKEVEFTLCAQADEADVNSGLLKSKTMTDMSGTVYKLAGGEKKTFEVVFTGENNGGTEKQNRLLPQITLDIK